MPGMDLNLGSSVFKREAKSMDKVVSRLKEEGWSETGSLGSRVRYFESSGISITVVEAAMGVLIFPSGPLRGRVFGDSGLNVNTTSVIGAGSNTDNDKEKQDRQASRKANQLT